MKIIPVIDIKGGIVVRGVAGERDSYRPVQSRLTDGHGVIEVAEALRDAFDVNDLYVADLDAILDRQPHESLYAELIARGFALHVDAGLRDARAATMLAELGVESVVAGLETIADPKHLTEMVEAVGPFRLVFSLDLQAGRPLVSAEHRERWPNEASEIAAIGYNAGIRRFIVLDLAAVGVDSGPATLPLCRELRERFDDIELITGGGIRNVDDLESLKKSGIDGVLIASALHNGAITRDDLLRLEGR